MSSRIASSCPTLWRKKPVAVDAWQLTADNIEAVFDWVADGIVDAGHNDVDVSANVGTDDPHIAIGTLEGVMRAEVGDYVIRGVQGEFYPCKPDIFAATYEGPLCPGCGGSAFMHTYTCIGKGWDE
jgi:hypothetical protein